MAKNNKNAVAVNIDAEEQKLLLQLEGLRKQKEQRETARLELIANQIREFPKMLGVANFGDVINLIKQVEKGTLGKLDASARTYKRLEQADKDKITARLKAGEQVSALAAEYGVSDGTVYGLKQDAGLTKTRTAPAAVAVVAPVAVPAAV